jgi:hypothetical protein
MNALDGSIQAEASAFVENKFRSYTQEGYAVKKQPEGTIIEFFDHDVEHGIKTREAGYPVYISKLHIRHRFPGQMHPMERLAEEKDKRAYPDAWARYQNKEKLEQTGLPLYKWGHPRFSEKRVELYNRFNIFTVEQLASVDPGRLSEVDPEGLNLQKDAKEFFANAEKNKSTSTSELERRLAVLEAQLAQRDEQMAEFSSRLGSINTVSELQDLKREAERTFSTPTKKRR